jgi:hypothetical protein
MSEPSKTAVDEIIPLPPVDISRMRQRALELTIAVIPNLDKTIVICDVAEDFYQFLKKGE